MDQNNQETMGKVENYRGILGICNLTKIQQVSQKNRLYCRESQKSLSGVAEDEGLFGKIE
jgi:hypothetical protein